MRISDWSSDTEIFGVIIAVDLCELRGGGERVGQAAELVDETELARGAAGPDAPFGDRLHLLDRLLAALGDEAGEAAVDVLDARLRELVELGVHAAEDVGLARQRGRRDAIGGHAYLGESLVAAGRDFENARTEEQQYEQQSL